MGAAAVLAHQGGWDEALLVLVPIAAVVGVVALARRRGRRLLEQAADDGPRPDPGTAGDDRAAGR